MNIGRRKSLARIMGQEALLTRIDTGKKAPNFALKALDGKEYSLASLLDRGPVVLAFFKISCPVCQFTFPFLQRISDRFAGKNISVIGVSQDDAPSTREFNQEYGVKFPTLIDDPDYSISNAYGLTTVPTVLLVGTDGKAKVSFTGFDKDELEKISGGLAQQQNISAAPLFHSEEIVPSSKPG
jgi:peroxiredoxin